MIHLYNANLMSVDIRWYAAQSLKIGKPKATQCQTVEQLAALDIVGIYGEEDGTDESGEPGNCRAGDRGIEPESKCRREVPVQPGDKR